MQGVGKAWIACVALALLGACAPALDWREVRTEGGVLTAWLPCKPQRRMREVELAGSKVSMEMLGCRAADSTWGLTGADVGEPARVEPALAALRQARSENLGAPPSAVSDVELAGRRATRLRIAGHGAEGQAVVEHSLIFASGTRVFHLAVIGAEPGTDALDAFFGQLRLAR
ncbi:MAG TPA: hypothetical protein VFR90_07815 [Methylibium sp.]|uniref:hypothetical protein n=1 Tax=Methylibium sp. TaxID=2067992 RepID=UPI002DB8A065|nr:hypothetical protein [Methylibium sp.]HEU4459013.1 hypothetical protein [Methylibium sp.]